MSLMSSMTSYGSKLVSFTPGFSPVKTHSRSSETVLTVSAAKAGKTHGKRFPAMPTYHRAKARCE